MPIPLSPKLETAGSPITSMNAALVSGLSRLKSSCSPERLGGGAAGMSFSSAGLAFDSRYEASGILGNASKNAASSA